jgi:hypothetical protein
MKHSKECIEFTAKSIQHQLDFLTKHPHYCKHCNGWGGHASTYDPSPAGVCLSAGSFGDFDPCRHCEGKCPVCADPLDDDEEHCTNCDTTRGQDGIPDPPECLCWMEEENEYYADLQKHNERKS